MIANSLFSEHIVAGWLLILSWIIFMPGGMLYAGSNLWNWPIKNPHRYLLWERGFVMSALLSAVVGFSILEGMLAAAGDTILAPAGMSLLLIGASVVIFAETYSISRQEWLYAPTVVFVILAFLAQAFFGAALLRTGLLPGWIGWLTILWNLGWLVILPMVRPKDMYYPWLHYVAPLLIGIGLLLNG